MRRTGLLTLDEAKHEIRRILADGEWHSSRAIHGELRPRMSEGMFLRVKSALNIEHRRVVGAAGAYYEWRLTKPPDKPAHQRLDTRS